MVEPPHCDFVKLLACQAEVLEVGWSDDLGVDVSMLSGEAERMVGVRGEL